jgi:hypothetical protein
VVVVRGIVLTARVTARTPRVIEPELDMRRSRARSSTFSRLISRLSWLTPGGGEIVTPPRRAVARELEEAWPAGER